MTSLDHRNVEISVNRHVGFSRDDVSITLTVHGIEKIKLDEVLEIFESEIPKEKFELFIIAKRLLDHLESTDLNTIRQLIIGV